MLLILATIATFAAIAWLATPYAREWPKGTRLLAIPAIGGITLGLLLYHHGPWWMQLTILLAGFAVSGVATHARDGRVARGDAG